MKKDPKIFLLDILDSVENIEKYTKNITKDQFFDNLQVQDAVVRRIEIIGEAVKNLPNEVRKKHPEIPWKDIAGTRDVIVHDYSGIDIDLVWEIVHDNIPKLKKQIANILRATRE